MSDPIKHECGIALLRLKKPIEYFIEKYGTAFYGVNKLHLLMEKQHNRGQDGAGVANIKLDMNPGERYISRIRSVNKTPIKDIFEQINSRFQDIYEKTPEKITKKAIIDFRSIVNFMSGILSTTVCLAASYLCLSVASSNIPSTMSSKRPLSLKSESTSFRNAFFALSASFCLLC